DGPPSPVIDKFRRNRSRMAVAGIMTAMYLTAQYIFAANLIGSGYRNAGICARPSHAVPLPLLLLCPNTLGVAGGSRHWFKRPAGGGQRLRPSRDATHPHFRSDATRS